MFNRDGKYNQQKLNRALTSAALRIVVAGYIIFIAYHVISGTRSEASTIPSWVGMLIGFVFIAASVGFIIYAVLSFRKALQSARLDAEEEIPEEKPASKTEPSIAEKVRAAEAMLRSDEEKKTDDQ